MVAAVRDDPARRLGLASRFYDDRPGCVSIRSYRRAEMAFMRWQIRRGLLAAPDAPRPGSEWWRAVNEGLLRDAWEADQLLAGLPGAGRRVLYAHALVASPKLALGRVRAVSRVLGDPRWRGADLFLSLHNILPVRYPLDGVSIRDILALENYAGRPDRLRRDAAPGTGPVRLRGGRSRRAPAARLRPGRPAGLRVDQRRGSSVDDQQEPQAQGRPALADLVLTRTLSVPAGSVLERLAHVLDLRRRLRLRVVLQYLDVLAQVSE